VVLGSSPPYGVRIVKIHEPPPQGLWDLTLICDVDGGALFSSCFINGAVKRNQECRQLVVEVGGAGSQKRVVN